MSCSLDLMRIVHADQNISLNELTMQGPRRAQVNHNPKRVVLSYTCVNEVTF